MSVRYSLTVQVHQCLRDRISFSASWQLLPRVQKKKTPGIRVPPEFVGLQSREPNKESMGGIRTIRGGLLIGCKHCFDSGSRNQTPPKPFRPEETHHLLDCAMGKDFGLLPVKVKGQMRESAHFRPREDGVTRNEL